MPQADVPQQRIVWQGRFGTMAIEVRDGEVYVNDERVEPAPAR